MRTSSDPPAVRVGREQQPTPPAKSRPADPRENPPRVVREHTHQPKGTP
jgi:hypothetical protein